jgi:hypothetical protein
MSSNFVRGALVQINKTFGVPTPNVIIFQYNPETLTHGWTPAEVDYQQAQGMNPLAVRGLPAESFTFTLVMDASDQIANGNPIAIASGIQARLAALEMLLFPAPVSPDPAVLMTVVNGPPGLTPSLDGFSPTVPAGELPVVLFVWGAARVVPVRVQSLSVSETLYDSLLNPTHAEASITLQVLTKQDLANSSGVTAAVARGAYSYTHASRRTLAIANLENAVEGVIGMIPLL